MLPDLFRQAWSNDEGCRQGVVEQAGVVPETQFGEPVLFSCLILKSIIHGAGTKTLMQINCFHPAFPKKGSDGLQLGTGARRGG